MSSLKLFIILGFHEVGNKKKIQYKLLTCQLPSKVIKSRSTVRFIPAKRIKILILVIFNVHIV